MELFLILIRPSIIFILSLNGSVPSINGSKIVLLSAEANPVFGSTTNTCRHSKWYFFEFILYLFEKFLKIGTIPSQFVYIPMF